MKLNVLLFIVLLHGAAAAVVSPTKWQTLSGNAPAVIARGGFSGLFPESSQFAYQFAQSTSLKNVVLYCDLQLTKDGAGICHSDLRLDNSTTISAVFPKGRTTYSVNGRPVQGWFSIDFTSDQLYNNVTLIQSIFSRPSVFDGNLPVSMVEDVAGLHPYQLWVNVQYSTFFKEHDLDAVDYIRSVSRETIIDCISSPEIGFLKSLSGLPGRHKTKLIFRFMEVDDVEPSTKKTYQALLNDLVTIKSFASGILVPKSYIWPVNKDQYLEAHTSLVTDAHGVGLEVYAYDFANDAPASYNYSYDPTVEYLQFISNSNFSVDGVLTDFPSTASEAVACLAHNENKPIPTEGKHTGRPLIITHNGASGMFAGCTDVAYQRAVEDGADVLDCSIQMSKDGVAFCLDSADLMGDTTAAAAFMPRAAMVPEIQQNNGIFSFDLTWSEIQSLKPALTSPMSQSGLARNPAAKSEGKFMTLADFLQFAKKSTVSGILINIENAAYLASKKGLGAVDAVSTALRNASYDKQVYIQSDDTAVLSAFKKNSGYQRVLHVKETISDAPKPTVEEIKQFADAVNLPRSSIVAASGFFVSAFTNVVDQMHAANISVYVSVLRNEFLTIAFDYFSDPMVELATYVAGVGVDGVVTEFPATAAAYLKSPCSDLNANLPYSILPAEPGTLLSLASPDAAPPAEAPAPVLEVADVVDPPLPPVADLVEKAPVTSPTTQHPPSGQPANVANAALCLLMAMLSFFALSGH
ncbi:unnamed protein product [Musa acuminata subsp. malaccensis]|uniref:glycerophosphodiester phosphodiesterase n=1 Tax=Musa acuminata subsp. malaccensis TaxID=214687 RepID=A0A8D7A2I0_MUSAM|nr:unnamed protein product [Musa acuminata subsp. malaccensis]